MKRLMLAVLAVLFAVTVSAVDAPTEPKVLQAKQGNVTFKHDTHKTVACEKCHGPGEAKAIGKMEKEKAHALCQACHKESKKGPTKCAECHKK
jgi:predicted CXXCH cytochrome family protein